MKKICVYATLVSLALFCLNGLSAFWFHRMIGMRIIGGEWIGTYGLGIEMEQIFPMEPAIGNAGIFYRIHFHWPSFLVTWLLVSLAGCLIKKHRV